MEAFTLDTSGAVVLTQPIQRKAGAVPYALSGRIIWSDLDALTHGYVEALILSLGPVFEEGQPDGSDYDRTEEHARFSDLAPETLAQIIADCARMTGALRLPNHGSTGRDCWNARQAGRMVSFPPLAPYLGDDGKVYLRDPS